MARYKYTITDDATGETSVVSKGEFLRSLGYNCAVRAAYGDDPEGECADEDFKSVLNDWTACIYCNGFIYCKEERQKL